MIVQLSILLFIIQIITSKLIEVNDKNSLKKELKSHANILILFFDNERSSTDVFKLLNDITDKASKISKLISVDCKANKKLCKQYKADSNTFIIQHFHKGKFNKVYDRKLNSKSLMRFLEDPTGDIPWEEDDTGKDVVHAKSSQELQKLVSSYKTNVPPLMLMFYAPWCGYCKKMKPEFGAAASSTKSRAIFIGINGDIATTDDLKQAFNVTGYPSVFLVKDGKNIFKFENENSKDALIKFVDNPTQPTKPKDVPWSEETNEIDFLSDSTFEEYLTQHQSILVMFYAPWCGHCKSMKPELVNAVKQLKKAEVTGRIAAVDSTEHKNISTFYNITGFPTLKYFKDGLYKFDVSERTAAGLVKFMQDPQKPKEPEVQVPWNQEQSLVHHPRPDAFKTTTKRYKHSLVMFYAPWCGHCKKAKPEFTAAANDMKDNDKVAFIAVDCADTEYNDLCKVENVEGFPTIRYYNYGKKTAHNEYSLEREQHDFVAFMKDPSNPKLDARRHWRHIAGNEAVEVLQTETFSQAVVSKMGGALIMFYAPWCGHCNAMKPAYVAAAMSLKTSLPTCVLGSVDATAEAKLASQYDINGFPTLIYFSSSGDWSKYTGERGEKDITEFMLKKNREVRFEEEEKKRVEKENEERKKKHEQEEKERILEEEKKQQEESERQEKEKREKEEKEKERQEIEMKQKKEAERIEKENIEAERKRQKEETDRKEKEAEKAQKDKQDKDEHQQKEEERKRQELERKEKEAAELKEKEKNEAEHKRQKEETVRKEKEAEKAREEKENREKEERQRQEEEKKLQERIVKEKEESERRERERIELEIKQREKDDADRHRQEAEMKQKEETEKRDKEEKERVEVEIKQREESAKRVKEGTDKKESDHMAKIESVDDFQSKIKSPALSLFYFHKGNKKGHVRARVLKFLEKNSERKMNSFDVDCGPLVALCDGLGIGQFPSILAFVNDRNTGTLSDSFSEGDLEHLVADSRREEL